ncbi:MAG: HAD-IA family hydrolase [Verrucomicrobia bacterium]|nr:HAD-IA family hydrolase [Verrucomicrobiota bacterium]
MLEGAFMVISENIEVISFDAGGTLLNPYPSVGDIYAMVAGSRHNQAPLPSILNQRFGEIWRQSGGFDFSMSSWREVVNFCFQPTHPDGVDDDLFDNLYRAFASIDHWRLFPDVELALELLRQNGYRLVIASNWDERLKSLIAGFGLDYHFDAVMVSVELGFTKPDTRFFDSLAQRMRTNPARILHVGDCPTRDLEAARQAGMSSVLIDRNGDGLEGNRIGSLLDLCDFSRVPGLQMEANDAPLD